MPTQRNQSSNDELARHQAYADRGRQRIAISGGSGSVGSRLVPFLKAGGHEVISLVRREARAGTPEVRWDPARGRLDPGTLEALDAVINLSGESVASGRWTPDKKRAIRESRTLTTSLLARTLAGLRQPPRVFVSASAIGYYGNRGDEPLTEESGPGRGFLADVSREWEAAAEPAARAGIRVVHPRIGIVLMAEAGVLGKMVPPFRLGAGGPIGSGDQWMSWVAAEDLVGILLHLLFAEGLSGPVNAVGPAPVRNREFAQTLGRVLHRPAAVPAPAFAVKMMLGKEAAEEMVLASERVLPQRLQSDGFRYLYPTLGDALRRELGA